MKINTKLINYISIFILSFGFNAVCETNIFDGATSIEKPFELKDPFLGPMLKKIKDSSIKSKVSQGVFDDSPQVDGKGIKLEDIEITGVIIGNERRAFAKVKGYKRIVILKEGMKLGENNAELRAILPGGLILVEKSINIYGEEEYLETVIPIVK